MSIDLEPRLRRSLAAQAASLAPDPDPWSRFAAQERRSRRRRRARVTGTALACLAPLGLAGVGILPVPSWAPAITLEQASSPLLAGPTRGSLGGDQEWLDRFRAYLPTLVEREWFGDGDGIWRVDGVERVRILFAGDVAGERLVFASVPVRTGFRRMETTGWFTAPAGAPPEEMTSGSRGGEPLKASVVTRLGRSPDALQPLVLAPAGARVEVSTSVSLPADGTVRRTWTPVPVAGTGEYTGRVPTDRPASPVALRVGLPGASWQSLGWEYDACCSDEVAQTSVDWNALLSAEASRSGLGAAHRRLASAAPFAGDLAAVGLDPARTRLRVLWAGSYLDKPALLLAAQQRGGGVLLHAVHGGPQEDYYAVYPGLRLLAPAAGAYSRPYGWRLPSMRGDAGSGLVGVWAPAGAAAVELRRADGTRTPVAIDSAGFGTATLGRDEPATVVTLDTDGSIVAETPVPTSGMGAPGIIGETAATSVVLASR